MDLPDLKAIKSLEGSALTEATYLVATRGYAVVPGYYPIETCEQLKTHLARALDEYRPVPGSVRSDKDRHHIHDLMNQSEVFVRLLEDGRLQQLLQPLLGEFWIMYAFTSSSVPPHGTNYGARLHNDCPRFAHGYTFNVGVIWALDAFTDSNGGTLVLPGSHHVEAPPSEEMFGKHSARLTVPQGSLILFNARLFHRTGENTTEQWRHALTMNACRSFMKQRVDWVRLIKSEYTSELNSQARRILGFDTRLPVNMEEFFLPEAERLYKPNQG